MDKAFIKWKDFSLNLNKQPWLRDPYLVRLVELLNLHGQARIVGGCIRDSLLGKETKDIDVATTLEPDEVKALLPIINAKAAKRRDDHGSVLVIIGDKAFDVTTLRKDVKTTGRHAEVTYTKDWAEDARRRDFTVNAIYCDLEGRIYDPLQSGLQDLKDKRLAFIGDLAKRVQEDYLRILRYFRFLAQLNWAEDWQTVKALEEFVSGLKILSIERIHDEFKKILNANNPNVATQLMDDIGIFQTLFGVNASLKNLTETRQRNPKLSFIGSLIALCPAATDLLLTKKDQRYAKIVLQEIETQRSSYPHLIYFHGCELAETVASLKDEMLQFRKDIDSMIKADFPIKSSDIDLAGPTLGKALKSIENWWVANHCRPNKEACIRWFESQRNKL